VIKRFARDLAAWLDTPEGRFAAGGGEQRSRLDWRLHVGDRAAVRYAFGNRLQPEGSRWPSISASATSRSMR
jgi:hypothetical protein